ncbi:uncharacterized protein LOC131630341 [Vicia villosa]|uniref:uncharacterized protein LOC131630341 n=1 Tax=Vicia villosa TaxID=3911 RepID=UPI00273AAB98|nr:uncharacterized protein LOC131630341 [Vicia villosa]
MLGEKPYFPVRNPKRKHHGGRIPPPPPSTEAYVEDLSNDLHGLICHSLRPPRLKYKYEIDEIEPVLEVTRFCFDEWTPPPDMSNVDERISAPAVDEWTPPPDMSNVDERISAPAVDEWTPPPPDMSNVDERISGPVVNKWTVDPITDILIPSPSSRLVGAGIENLGQTCFMAAILQCLTHTGQLFRGLPYSSHDTPCHVSGFCVICAFREHNDRALDLSRKTIYPRRFFQNLKYFSAAFRQFNQNDAHKFMICALDKLKDAFPKDQNNLIEQIFGGKIVSKTSMLQLWFFL